MAAAKARLVQLRSSRYASATIEGYASDWKHFEEWCASAQRDPLPAHPETVALYLSHMLPAYKVSSLERRVAAIASKHLVAEFPAPITPMVRQVLASARRSKRQKIRRKAPISIEELAKVAEFLATAGSLRAIRNRTAILLGFAGAFRRSELSSLDMADVDLAEDRVTVSLGRSKTDQQGRGRVLVIPRANRAGVCCVRALAQWIGLRGKSPGPLFVGVKRGNRKDIPGDELRPDKRMNGAEVYWALRAAAAGAGLDAARFGAHSLRAGFVTASADAGADVWDIMATTGHKSVENLGMYVRRAVPNYPLRAVL